MGLEVLIEVGLESPAASQEQAWIKLLDEVPKKITKKGSSKRHSHQQS